MNAHDAAPAMLLEMDGQMEKNPRSVRGRKKKDEKKNQCLNALRFVTIGGAIDVDTATMHGPPTAPGYRVPFLLQLFCQLFFFYLLNVPV